MGRIAWTVRREAAWLLCLVLAAATLGCTTTSYDCGKLGTVTVGPKDGGIFGSFIDGFFDALFDRDDDDDDDDDDDEAAAGNTCVRGSRGHSGHIHVPGQRRRP